MTVSSCLRQILKISIVFDSFAKYYRHIPRSVCLLTHGLLTFSVIQLTKSKLIHHLPSAISSWKNTWPLLFFFLHYFLFKIMCRYLMEKKLPSNWFILSSNVGKSVSSATELLRNRPRHFRPGIPPSALAPEWQNSRQTHGLNVETWREVSEPRRCWIPSLMLLNKMWLASVLEQLVDEWLTAGGLKLHLT